MPNRSCTMPACGKPHRAKGYCSTHYNQLVLRAERHPLRPTACTVCRSPLMRLPRGKIRPTCSPDCRTILQWGHPSSGTSYDRDQAARVRAIKLGATDVELVSVAAIFERDDWTCYLCEQPVDPDADCYQLDCATIDHVVPLAQGGAHTAANLRCCCLDCNSRKGEYADRHTA